MYGFHPSLPAMPEPPYNMQAPADFIDNIHRTVAATRDALLDALFFDDISYRYCVPRSLVPHLLHTHHDLPIAGHVGVTKLFCIQ